MITKDLIHEAQNKWGEGIVKIGSLKNNQSECIDFTTSFLNDMYNFKNGEVLFKPTKAANQQFRPNFSMALSMLFMLCEGVARNVCVLFLKNL